MRPGWLSIFSASILLVAIASAQTQPPPRAGQDEIKLDVSGLVTQLQPQGAEPLDGLGISPKSAPSLPTRQQNMAAAAAWLQHAAGTVPIHIQVPEFGDELKLTGPAPVLQQVKQAVQKATALPAGAGQIMIEFRMLTLSKETIAKADKDLRAKLLATMIPDTDDAQSLAQREVFWLIKNCSTEIQALRICIFDGMRAVVLVSAERTFVAGVVRGSTTNPSHSQEMGTVHSGVALNCTAKIDINKKINVHLRSRFTRLLELKASADEAGVQIPVLEDVRFEPRCSMDDQGILLFHGTPEIVNGPTTRATTDETFFVITSQTLKP
jgi:hypothetical protein